MASIGVPPTLMARIQRQGIPRTYKRRIAASCGLSAERDPRGNVANAILMVLLLAVDGSYSTLLHRQAPRGTRASSGPEPEPVTNPPTSHHMPDGAVVTSSTVASRLASQPGRGSGRPAPTSA
jgi:hypothetical protein